MKKPLLLVCLLSATTAASAAEAKWISLFDGKTLNGWKSLDGQAKFEVVEGTIQGTVVPGRN